MSESAVYRNALAAGISLNEYRLESVLGAGGFGITYLARDVHLDKPVAIKEYLPGDLALRALDGSVVPVSTGHRTDYQWGLDRFIQEARTLARFSHPHIVRVNRYFELNGTGYMVMDYEEGESLHARLKRAPLPAEDELRGLLLPLLDGLAAVHAANFLHRDIKPANIFIRRDGRPVLLDFGAARATGGATRSLTAVLTPGYAPLEQYSPDGKQGPWSDLYALAGVVFRMVTDRNPPDAVGRLQTDTVAAALQAARSRYSPPLINAVDWALSVKAELRPQTVAHWRAVLEGAPRVAPAVTTTPATLAAPTLPAAQAAAASRLHTMPPVTRVSTTRTVPVAADHSESWRRVGWTLFWVIAAIVATGWYLKRKPEPPPPPPAVAAPSAKRAPVQVEVVETPALAVLPAAPAIAAVAPAPAPAADIVVVKPVEPPPGRVPERVADEFRGADRDNDGYLAPAEVEGRFPFIAKEFNKVDRDGDRRISLDEFAELRRQQFERKPLQK